MAALVNEILDEADARPYLSRHDEWDWHLHVTRPETPLADRMPLLTHPASCSQSLGVAYDVKPPLP